ncbi:hypothetical protein N657DRAFT_642977 [Parathielavia appendiculata]|uniref:MOSC domain-containing protein n=1 Tax=Parathielavia appendiculata TaxID=2587402 RepID=A0AAN6Z6N6_9PEZI|nr:hypothetical protein N657DRAFT_642977 [Parathielavia appendiculata]
MDGSTAARGGPTIDSTSAFVLLVTTLAFFLPLLIHFPPIPPSKRDALLETHTEIGLRPSKSRLQGNLKVEAGSTATSNQTQIRSLWIYPLKSCKGIEVCQSKVLPTGLEYDRLYTFAQLGHPGPVGAQRSRSSDRDEKWQFITQRQFPLLAMVQVDLFIPDIARARGQPSKVSEPFLLVRFPWQEPGLRGMLAWTAAKLARGWRARPEKEFVLPVAFPSEDEIEARGYTREPVTIWRDTVEALNMEAELPRELSLYLGVNDRLGLFRVDPARLRDVYRCAPTLHDVGYQPVTNFQDAYPLHLLNLASVRDFDAKIEKDKALPVLDPRRFRANIIVDGGNTPYDEETWKKIRFTPRPGSKREASTFHVSCRTVRCKMPNVDQDTGHRHPVEPDKALRKFRDVDEGAKHKGCLGMQLTPLFSKTESHEDLESWVEVGMSVQLLERGRHVYIPQ